MVMYYTDLIKEFNDKYQLNLEDDRIDFVKLTINGDTNVSFYSKDDGRSVLIESEVYELEEFIEIDFFKHLLAANFEGMIPWGAYFVLNPETHRVVLVKTVLLEHLNVDSFLTQLEEFLGSQEKIRLNIYHWKTESFFNSRRKNESLLSKKI